MPKMTFRDLLPFYGLNRYRFVTNSSRNESRAVILITPKSSSPK